MEVLTKIIVYIAIIISLAYTYLYFFVKKDTIRDFKIDCFAIGFSLLVAFGIIHIIYWAMKSATPYMLIPCLVVGIYLIVLGICYHIKEQRLLK